MKQGELINELTTLEANPMKEAARFSNHQAIKEAANKIISFISRGSSSLRDSLVFLEVRKALLPLRGPMAGII